MAHAMNGNAKARKNRAAKNKRQPSCICCKARSVRCRGLCEHCYKSALYQISIGKTTNDELEQNQLILPVKGSTAMRKAVEAIEAKRSL